MRATPRLLPAAVCEPIHRFHLEIPSNKFGAVSQALAQLKAPPHTVTTFQDAARSELHFIADLYWPGRIRPSSAR